MKRVRTANNLPPVGFGYIVIPSRVDRDKFVQTCYNKERISIVTENGALIKDCYASKTVIRDVSFPAKSGILGELVCWVSDSFHSKPTIIALLSKESESQLVKEGGFTIQKNFGGNEISISASSKDGVFNLSVSAKDGGVVNINSSGNSGAKINLNCTGDININSSTKVAIKPKNRLDLFSGGSPAALGDKLVDELNVLKANIDLIMDAIKNGTVVTGDGGASYKASMITIIDTGKQDSDIDSVLSEKTFLD